LTNGGYATGKDCSGVAPVMCCHFHAWLRYDEIIMHIHPLVVITIQNPLLRLRYLRWSGNLFNAQPKTRLWQTQ